MIVVATQALVSDKQRTKANPKYKVSCVTVFLLQFNTEE